MPVLQSLMPVSLRHPDDRGSLGNQVTALVVRLPIGDRAPAARLSEVVAETTRVKSGTDGAGLDLLLRWTDTWPMPLLTWGAGLIHHQPFAMWGRMGRMEEVEVRAVLELLAGILTPERADRVFEAAARSPRPSVTAGSGT